jgi:hypothetical protein
MNITNMRDLAVNVPRLTMLYGSPGSGKTSIAISGIHRKLLVDLERGASRAIPNNYTDVWIPQSLGEFMGELSGEDVKCYDVIVIDTLGRLVELLVRKHSNASGIANQQTWGSVRRDLLNWWQSLLKLDKHIVLTAHGKQDGDTYRPEVLGNSPALILRDLDYVGVVKHHTVMFNLPNSWCKNTHSRMADEVSISEHGKGFLEILVGVTDTVNDIAA